jgi:hypothetical protein
MDLKNNQQTAPVQTSYISVLVPVAIRTKVTRKRANGSDAVSACCFSTVFLIGVAFVIGFGIMFGVGFSKARGIEGMDPENDFTSLGDDACSVSTLNFVSRLVKENELTDRCDVQYEPVFKYTGLTYREQVRTGSYRLYNTATYTDGDGNEVSHEDICDASLTERFLGQPLEVGLLSENKCWKPTNGAEIDVDNYRCGNDACLKIIPPQFEKDLIINYTIVLTIIGLLLMLIGVSCVCFGFSGIFEKD